MNKAIVTILVITAGLIDVLIITALVSAYNNKTTATCPMGTMQERGNMPRVGKKHFAYSAAGKKKAKAYAKKVGKKVKRKPKKKRAGGY
jgi:hypothetical protein